MRHYPHRPIIFDLVADNGGCAWKFLEDHETGLIPVVASGLGCCLIKTSVFRAMEDPWITLGELNPENWDDDISFFNRARQAGFQLYCDLDLHLGHMCTITVFPARSASGEWVIAYDSQGKGTPSFMMEKMSREEKEAREKYNELIAAR